MNKTARLVLCVILALTLAAGAASAFGGAITVVSREDGSGTRGAFIELFGILKDGNDMTTEEAMITNSTSVMMTTVAGNAQAIGYISLGSLNDTVKALDIDGSAATAKNIIAGSYKIARPFTIAIMGDVSEPATDFIAFILSANGQRVVEENKYVRMSEAPAYRGRQLSGTVVVAGSSSVTPVMEKLKEAYKAVNPGVDIEVQQSDSTTGMNAVIDGIAEIGMASRELKHSELEKELKPIVIAMDGIAVIVSNGNPLSNLPAETIKRIFTGELTEWENVLKCTANEV